jgi:hypothetical protein
MPIALGQGLFGVILPIAETNIALNASFEQGNAGVVAIQGATLGTTSQFQRYGAWSLKVTPSSNGTSGAILGTYQVSAGTTYSVSVWAFVESGVPMRLGVGDSNGLNLQTNGTTTFTGGGTWQWYPCPGLSEGGAATRSVVLQKSSGNSQLSYYVDGLKISPWTDGIDRVTSYVDGDTGGGTWQGAQHASASYRSSQYRGGGSIIALADLGLQVDQSLGVGVPPIEISAQSYAVTPGAQFQRQRPAARQFTLTAKPMVGTSLADFHVTRRTVYDALKPDLVTPQQPVRLLYYGAQGTQQIDAYYQKGLELGNMDGPIAEHLAIGFTATDPYWYAPVQQGTTLAPRTSLGSVNYIARRSPTGQWGTLGANGSTVINAPSGITTITALAVNPGGTVFLGGNFGTVAGTWSPHVGMYFPQTNRFGTLQGGTLDVAAGNGAYAIAFNPAGTAFIGGNFLTAAGTRASGIACWSGAFGTLQGGTLNLAGGIVWDLLYSPLGTLFIGGQFDNIQGTANSRNIAMWSGAFGSLGGTVGRTVGSAVVQALAWGADNRLYLGGDFFLVNGSIGTSVAFWKGGAFGTMGRIGEDTNRTVRGMAIGLNGQLYAGGNYTQTSSGSALRASAWNGVQHSALGNGLNNQANAVLADPVTGNVIYGGAFTGAGSINAPASYAVWNGATWILADVNFIGAGFSNGTINAMALGNDRSLYVAGDFAGTAQAASIGTLVNVGRAEVYPTMRLRNLSATGTARIYQLVNTTTGDGLYFNYVMQPSETALLTLQPAARSFQSSSQGNIFGLIMPGSNLASFRLLPGTNYVSFFSDNDSLETSFFWQPVGPSIDSGTVF